MHKRHCNPKKFEKRVHSACIRLSAWLGRYFFVVVGFGWGFLTFGTLKPWMCGNSRSLAAWSECHSVFVKISHESHMQGVSYFMEEVGFLIKLCMCTANPVWLK